jgi:cytochrome c biogenesis protein CcmG/thiol:disulfide interchange protein DsbE
MTPSPVAFLLDAPMALYLAWVAFTVALVVIGVIWVFRPSLASQPLKRIGVVWIAMTVFVVFVTFRVFARQSNGPERRMAPDFALHTVDGQSLTRGSLRGKVVLLEFWASWCGPCRESLPEMFRLHGEFTDPRFVMIGVNEDENQTKFEDFVAQKGIRWPQDWDPKGDLLSRFSSDAIPSYALIGPHGHLRFMQKGYTSDTYLRLREAISDALSERVASNKP